ncbi:hypothetical protein Tco_0956277 [Tanacetum coccineum]|uniref:Uncharacterized protein n=1 Tax=Tanacetum coccineum TaxID=301880 RepID=A0ABQ5EAH1_9ASTR
MHSVDPPSPDYVPGPEEPEQASLSPDYVPGPEYPKYLALCNKEVPVEDQPYAAADSPIALSLGYIANSDPEEDPEDESEDGPTDYLANVGDEDDDDDSSGDDADYKDEEEASKEDEDEEEEEEHLAPADSTTATSPVVDPVPSAEETEPFEIDEFAVTPPPPPAYRIIAKMSIRAQTPIPFPSKVEVDRLLSIPTPPPSPLTPLSSLLPQIPSPQLLVSSLPLPLPSLLTTSPTDAGAPLGYRAAGIRLRTASPPPLPISSPLPLSPPIILPRNRASMIPPSGTPPSGTSPSGTPPILPIPLPTSSLPLPLPSTDRRADVPEAVLPPRKRLYIALGPRFEVGECSSAAARPTGGFRADYGFVGTLDSEIRRDPNREVGYEITDVWVDPAEATEEIPPTTLVELSQRVTDFVTNVRHDTNEIYVRLDDAQSDRSLMTGQLNVLRKDRRYHANTALLVEREAMVAQEEWAQSMDASHRVRYEVMTLRTRVSALKTENGELRAADRIRQT